MHLYTYNSISVCLYVCMFDYMHACLMYACMYTYVRIYAYLCVCLCVLCDTCLSLRVVFQQPGPLHSFRPSSLVPFAANLSPRSLPSYTSS